MKKIVTVACMALACATLAAGLTACTAADRTSDFSGGTGKVSDLKSIDAFYQIDEPKGIFTKAETIDGLKGYEYFTNDGAFIRLTKTVDGSLKSIALLNSETGKIILLDAEGTATGSKEWTIASFSSYASLDYYNEYEEYEAWASMERTVLVATLSYTDSEDSAKDYTKSYFYDKNGKVFAEIDGFIGANDIQVSGMQIAGEPAVRFALSDENGTPVNYYFNGDGDKLDYEYKPEDNLFTAELRDEVDEYENGYLYLDDVTDCIIFYNKDWTVKHKLDLPSYANMGAIVRFDNGNYIVQYSVAKALDAEKYDYLSGAMKFDLTTKLVDVQNATAKVTDLDWNYLLRGSSIVTPKSVEESGEVWSFAEGVAAYMQGIGEIAEDGMVDYNHNRDWFAITESGELRRTKAVVEDMEIEYVKRLASGSFIVMDAMERMYVVSANGEILREVNVAAFEEAAVAGNNYFTQIGKDIYNMEFNKVYTLADGYEVYGFMKGAVVIEQSIANADADGGFDRKWYLLKGSALTEIADSTKGQDVYTMNGVGLAVIERGTDSYKCTYYNENGDKITSINDQIFISDALGGAEDGSTVYCAYVIYNADQTVKEQGVMKLSK